MGYIRSKSTFLWHRNQLVRALRDIETGKATHLTKGEKKILVAGIKQRIAELNAKIEGTENA